MGVGAAVSVVVVAAPQPAGALRLAPRRAAVSCGAGRGTVSGAITLVHTARLFSVICRR